MTFAYRFSPAVELRVGADNVFDVYPDRVRDPRLTNGGTVAYSRFATRFGFNGASCYAALLFKF